MARSRRSSETDPDPSGRHRFVEADAGAEDVRPALALYSTHGAHITSQIAVATASLRVSRCALSGCGESREHPVHRPDEQAVAAGDEWQVPAGPPEAAADANPADWDPDSDDADDEWQALVSLEETENGATLERARPARPTRRG
jgi:hypothetical protein